MPWLAGLHVLHAPRTAASLDAVAGAALHLRGLALRDSGDVLEQGWPALKVRGLGWKWLFSLAACAWIQAMPAHATAALCWWFKLLAQAGMPCSGVSPHPHLWFVLCRRST